MCDYDEYELVICDDADELVISSCQLLSTT